MDYSWTPTASTHCIRITMQDDHSVTREYNKMESVSLTHISHTDFCLEFVISQADSQLLLCAGWYFLHESML